MPSSTLAPEMNLAALLLDRLAKREIDTGPIERDVSSLAKGGAIESFDIHPQSIGIAFDGQFSAVGTAYVKLPYTKTVIVAEEFPIMISGRVRSDGTVEVEPPRIDLSAFAA